ncbi:PEP/pyruvate-binding domain-containing protein [Pseudonocardia bannensis]|uniref:Phosphoenolpyruvate synthase n=1 Tax=Pseudonocardia bannensis TaxID=630973 RepID=A0A848DGJ2_9PSEU|nr:PEP/pyruvate-binding domain-containing protein [Pseudonocardia bannensis]NMH91675.1 phosphoenolpyruvate synthase [Pseudonocardia bannensis]
MVTTQPPGAATDRALVLDLARLDAARLPQVGGKAANLGELLGAGFEVPGGFCVTTAAYARVADAAGLDAVLPNSFRPGEPAPERIRERLLATPVPTDIVAAVTAAYAGLGPDVPVAVRSSATAEDLPGASFAGQQDTYLNVVGPDAVLDAVRRCWASLWTDRAVSYRVSTGIDQRTVRLAAVVQRMVDARVAGVAFTADPLTGRRGWTVIDASPGLGEAVVSGAVNPDHVVVDAEGGIVERRAGDKRVEVRSLPGGGTERLTRDGADDRFGQLCLSDPQLRELAALGRRVQDHYGAPQDIEWAVDAAGRIWLTQARPITTLFPIPEPVRAGRVYFCVSLAQGLVRPLTPMGIAAFRVLGSVAAHHLFGVPVGDPRTGPPAFATAGGRLFIDLTTALRSRAGRTLMPRVLDVMEARSATVLRSLFDDPAFSVRSTSWWPFVRNVARVAARFRIPLRAVQALVSPAAGRRHADRVGRRLQDLLAATGERTATQRLDRVERLLQAIFPIMPTVVPVAGAGFAMLGLARRLAGADFRANDVHEVLRSLPHNVTTMMDLELWALATRLRADTAAAAALREQDPAELAARYQHGALSGVLQDGLAGFLRRHGHRAVAEIDLGVPRWSDDPAYVLGVLANYLRLVVEADPALAPDAQFARGERAARAAVDTVVGRVARRSRVRARLVRLALGRVRELAGMRETHKDFLVRVLAEARAELANVGAELTARGLLDGADDVFFLDLEQVRTAIGGADLRDVVTRRREDHDQELRRRQVPRIVLSDGTQPEAVRAGAAGRGRPTDGVLAGSPASAGTVTAPARVVLDPVGAHLEPGEILVVPSTDPGWTPLFLTAGGLVMEMGGSNSHGAVVAREYGIPAVVGVPDATLRIATGQEITVDGAAGTVVTS